MSSAEIMALSVASIACAFDIKSARIPNALTFAAAACGLMFHAVTPGGQGLGLAAAGLFVGLALFFPLFALGAMGAGDVKLLGALGAWLGWHPVIFVALYGSIAGGVLALAVALANGYLRQAVRNVFGLVSYWSVAGVRPLPALTLDSATALRLPYALPIAVGLMVTLWRL